MYRTVKDILQNIIMFKDKLCDIIYVANAAFLSVSQFYNRFAVYFETYEI